MDKNEDRPPLSIEEWFGLGHAQFLTLPRLVMQSMPLDWQQKMVALLVQVDSTFDWRPKDGSRYWVSMKDQFGQFCKLEYGDYRHGTPPPGINLI